MFFFIGDLRLCRIYFSGRSLLSFRSSQGLLLLLMLTKRMLQYIDDFFHFFFFNVWSSLLDHPCSSSNAGCSHLCLLIPGGYSCSCPDHLDSGEVCLTSRKWNEDKKRDLYVLEFELFSYLTSENAVS